MQLSVTRDKYKGHAKSPRLAADAAAACNLLEGSGLSLCDAVRQLFAAVHAQGVACAPFIPSGGAGQK